MGISCARFCIPSPMNLCPQMDNDPLMLNDDDEKEENVEKEEKESDKDTMQSAIVDWLNRFELIDDSLPSYSVRLLSTLYHLLVHRTIPVELSNPGIHSSSSASFSASSSTSSSTSVSASPTLTEEELGILYLYAGNYYMYVCKIPLLAVDWYIHSTEKQHSHANMAWHQLGNYYDDMNKRAEAKNCYKQSFRLNPQNANAAFQVGLYYWDDEFFETAAKWFSRGARLKDVSCIFFLGRIYEERKNRKKAEKWYMRGVEMGHVESMTRLACLLFHSKNNKKHHERIKQLYEQAATLGCIPAMANLGGILYTIDKKREEGKQWIIKAANENCLDAMRELGRLYCEEENKEDEAIQWYKMAAEHGDATSMVEVAFHFEKDPCSAPFASYWYHRVCETEDTKQIDRIVKRHGIFDIKLLTRYRHCLSRATEERLDRYMYQYVFHSTHKKLESSESSKTSMEMTEKEECDICCDHKHPIVHISCDCHIRLCANCYSTLPICPWCRIPFV